MPSIFEHLPSAISCAKTPLKLNLKFIRDLEMCPTGCAGWELGIDVKQCQLSSIVSPTFKFWLGFVSESLSLTLTTPSGSGYYYHHWHWLPMCYGLPRHVTTHMFILSLTLSHGTLAGTYVVPRLCVPLAGHQCQYHFFTVNALKLSLLVFFQVAQRHSQWSWCVMGSPDMSPPTCSYSPLPHLMELWPGPSTPLSCATGTGRTPIIVSITFSLWTHSSWAYSSSSRLPRDTLQWSWRVMDSPDTSPTWSYPTLPRFMELWPDPTPSLHALLARPDSDYLEILIAFVTDTLTISKCIK